MKTLVILFLFLLSSSAFCAEKVQIVSSDKVGATEKSDIADLGFVNPSRPGVKYFELHLVPDMEVSADSKYVPVTPGAVPSKDDRIYKPSLLSTDKTTLVTPTSYPNSEDVFLGKVSALGAKLSDIINQVKNDTESKYTDLKNLINSVTTPGGIPNSGLPTGLSGNVFTTSSGQNFRLTYNNYTSGMDPAYFSNQYAVATLKFPLSPVGGCFTTTSSGNGEWMCYGAGNTYNGWMTRWYSFSGVSTQNPATIAPTDDVVDFGAMKENFAAITSAIDNDVTEVIKDLPNSKVYGADGIPSTVADTAATGLTQAEIDALLAQNTATVAKMASDIANAVAAANPNDATAQIAAAQAALAAAKAAQDANTATGSGTGDDEEGDDDETFNGITSEGFAEEYKPSEEDFNIPNRFNTFISNVQSSGLFSFSSSFFNSIPGGGSPVYTIDAGQYGEHIIDLSETMSLGLAVLKTILLACFGFLSIRAVIMKR